MTINSKFTFYSRAEYYHELANRVSKTKKGDRVCVATMTFKPAEPPIGRIMKELKAAAARGVSVELIVDAFPFLISDGIGPGPLLFARRMPRILPKTFRVRLQALEDLQAQGGRYAITNQPARPLTNPFAGRSHIKLAVINNYVMVGGCNLTKADHLDLMAGWEDAHIADWLCDFAHSVTKHESVIKVMGAADKSLKVDKTTRLIIDAGTPNQSLILNEALALIDAAQKHILVTCQYFPNDITAKHLAAAHNRGVSVKIIYNHPSKHVPPLNLLHHGVLWAEQRNKPKALFKNQLSKDQDFLHAKLLVTDQGTMLGSHNYVRAGVTFGTAEIALISSGTNFGERATRALEDQLLTTEDAALRG